MKIIIKKENIIKHSKQGHVQKARVLVVENKKYKKEKYPKKIFEY